MEKNSVEEVEEKIKRLNYLEQLRMELEVSDKMKKRGFFKKTLLLLLVLLCSVTILGNLYMHRQYKQLQRDITMMEDDLRSVASEVRTAQENPKDER